jgi:hypothetical protein
MLEGWADPRFYVDVETYSSTWPVIYQLLTSHISSWVTLVKLLLTLIILNNFIIIIADIYVDRLCGLVGRVSGYRSRGPGFDFQCYQIFWEVLGLERGPLSLVRKTEELFQVNSGSGLENWKRPWGIRFTDTLYSLKLALTPPIGGGRSVSIVRLRTKATEFSLFISTSPHETWCVYYATWGHLNCVINKPLPSIVPTLQPSKLSCQILSL